MFLGFIRYNNKNNQYFTYDKMYQQCIQYIEQVFTMEDLPSILHASSKIINNNNELLEHYQVDPETISVDFIKSNEYYHLYDEVHPVVHNEYFDHRYDFDKYQIGQFELKQNDNLVVSISIYVNSNKSKKDIH